MCGFINRFYRLTPRGIGKSFLPPIPSRRHQRRRMARYGGQNANERREFLKRLNSRGRVEFAETLRQRRFQHDKRRGSLAIRFLLKRNRKSLKRVFRRSRGRDSALVDSRQHSRRTVPFGSGYGISVSQSAFVFVPRIRIGIYGKRKRNKRQQR